MDDTTVLFFFILTIRLLRIEPILVEHLFVNGCRSRCHLMLSDLQRPTKSAIFVYNFFN